MTAGGLSNSVWKKGTRNLTRSKCALMGERNAMRKLTRGTLVLMFGLLIVITALPAFSATLDEMAVAECMDQWAKALDAGDVSLLSSLLTDDASIESSDLRKVVGKNDFLTAFEKGFKTRKSTFRTITKRLLELPITVSGNQAIAIRKVEVTVTGPDMRQPWRGTVASEYRLRRENGAWKIYYNRDN